MTMKTLEAFGIKEGRGKYCEETVYSLALIYNLIYNELSSYFDQYNLSLGKFNILMVVRHQGREKGIPQVEISRHLIVTASNMTKLIDKLEKDGLVVRSSQEGDRRVHITRITEKGSALLDRVWGGYSQRLAALMSQFHKEDQRVLSKLLSAWLDKLMRGKTHGV